MAGQPLKNIKVLDLTYYVAGPGASRILADWGADVIKVEPVGGEPGRVTSLTLGMPATEEINPYFGIYNINKKAIALNLKEPTGMEVFQRLLAEANVFVTSFRPGALKRLGLDYETLHDKYPGLIWASINGFGEEGPDKAKAGFDTVAFWARSGAMMDLVEKNTAPVIPTLAFGDSITACSLAGGICAALYKQAMTGEGSKVMVSLYAQALWCLAPVIASAQFGDVYPKSRNFPNTPLVNSYQTKEGKWLFISVFDERLYPVFLDKVVQRSDLAADSRYNNSLEAKKHSGELTEILSEEFRKLSQEELVERLLKADIAFERINHAADVLSDPQAIENQYLIDYVHRNGQVTKGAVPPVKFDTPECEIRMNYPNVGENSKEILKQMGYTEKEMEEMKEKGVVGFRE